MKQTQTQAKTAKNRLYTSILLVLLALVAITAATVAWFSIADNTKVQSMSLDIMADIDMRMDLDEHTSIDQYVKTISFETIAQRMQRDKGYDMRSTPLEPVTTSDQKTFTYENGTVVSNTSGAYLEFTLHFMAEKDMLVHLTSANSGAGKQDGTLITSQNADVPKAMRISFAADGQRWVYNPGMRSGSNVINGVRTFGLPDADKMRLNDDNAMFSLKEGEDKAVEVHIWLEGTDEACTDAIQSADYAIRMRFTGESQENTSNET